MEEDNKNEGSEERDSEETKNAIKKGTLEKVLIQDQMKGAYLDYAMSVIIGRALPDVRDGLKPVHRRILWAMWERSWRHNRPYVKSAKIVGEVIGNFHPHGDTAVYDTMVRMAQDFALGVPLIDGQGNYGSVDGDNAAAYRYTEARLTKMAETLLKDIDKETVDFQLNFDETRKEPLVLPSAFPGLLVNGSSGIAVGMATNIPPHNLAEVVSGIEALIANPEITIDELMKFIPAPDFPTGGIILAGDGLRKAYHTGNGSIKIRGKAEIVELKKKTAIIITEIPYQVNKLNMINRIAGHVNNKVIEGISDIRDESNRLGIRVVVELKKNVNAQVILNQLYKLSQLEVSFGINLLAIVKRRPRQLNLKQILVEYLNHRTEVITRRTQFELDRAKKRAHILEGLKIALDNIDEVIKVIRASRSVSIAREALMATFSLSEVQATAILEMKLQKLTSLEVQKIIEELERLKVLIAELEEILASPEKITEIVKDELTEVRTGKKIRKNLSIDNVGDSDDAEQTVDEDKAKKEAKNRFVRRTTLSDIDGTISFNEKDLIVDKQIVVTLTSSGYIKSLLLDSFRRQKRGGKGVSGTNKSGDDFPKFMLVGKRLQKMLFFTNRGRVFQLDCHELPETSKDAKGKSVRNFLSIEADEKISAITLIDSFNDHDVLSMVTKNGILKKSKLNVFKNVKKRGIVAITLKENDELIDVKLTNPDDDILMASSFGQGLRTNLAKMREMGRTAAGIIGMRMAPGDSILGMAVVKPETSLVVLTENGYGKRISYDNFPAKGRGGKGVVYLKLGEKSGVCIGIASVSEKDELMMITKSSMMIRIKADSMREMGRSTVGVRVVNLKENDLLSEMGVIPDSESESEAKPEIEKEK